MNSAVATMSGVIMSAGKADHSELSGIGLLQGVTA